MIVKIDLSDGRYRLYNKITHTIALPMREIIKDCKGKWTKNYKLYRELKDGVEEVGTIRVRDLLLMPPDINPVFASLQALRGEGYTWEDFVESRKKKLKKGGSQ